MTRNEIVVGLDDSPSGKAALSWAAEQAIRMGAVLRAVHDLDWPRGSSTAFLAPIEARDMSYGEAQEAYLASITRVFDDISPRPEWLIEFATGEPGPVLIRESSDAQLLVVGTHEHVGLGRLLVGSISHYCLSRASCPVVAVPASIESGPAQLLDQQAGGAST